VRRQTQKKNVSILAVIIATLDKKCIYEHIHTYLNEEGKKMRQQMAAILPLSLLLLKKTEDEESKEEEKITIFSLLFF
jgi:hypothetical protein